MANRPLTIEPDVQRLLEKIDRENRGEFTSDESCSEILASAVLLSVIVPNEALRPQVLFATLISECGLDQQWVEGWMLGTQGVFGSIKDKALPLIRAHVQALYDCFRQRIQDQLDELQRKWAHLSKPPSLSLLSDEEL